MLKYIKIYILFIVTIGFISCSNDNEVAPLFNQDIDTRVNELLASYKKTLTDAEFGWIADYQPIDNKTTGVYNIHLKFNEDNSVNLVSDYNGGTDDLVSSYRVGKSQLPELVFENYTVLHRLFEVNRFSLEAEFEYIIKEVSSDVIKLESKTDNGDKKSTLILTKATANDKENVKKLQGLDNRVKNGYNTTLAFRGITITNTASDLIFSGSFSYDELTRIATVIYEDADNNEKIDKLAIELTEGGINFVSPVTFAGTEFQVFTYDEDSNTFKSTIGDLTAVISASNEPSYINNDILNIQNGTRTIFGYRPIYGDAQFMSQEFLDIFTTIDANLAPNGLNMEIYFFILDFSTPTPTATMTFRAINKAGDRRFVGNYSFNVSIVNKKLFLTLIGATNANGGFFQSRIKPLLDFWTSPNGLLYTERGNFRTFNNNFTNQSGSFFSIDNPISSYVIWFQ
ncbi:DUF4302 domain-containing protein [Aquimarina longa]|uniref:DUF4302 domain-containing protein n=1 Tax=Aquimarina longa TaxID=1080221 RepID=UPI000781808F|nr:DUF4302 domain-containing protein [Aquimarina longa]